MHIGFALYGGLDQQSGGFHYDCRLVEELRAGGDTVEVINLPWRSYPRGLIDNLSPPPLDRPHDDFDVLLQDELAHPSLLRANRQVSCPVVCIVHHLRADEGRPLTPLYRAVERRYLDTVDAARLIEAVRGTDTRCGSSTLYEDDRAGAHPEPQRATKMTSAEATGSGQRRPYHGRIGHILSGSHP